MACLGVDEVVATEKTDTGGLLTACGVVKNSVIAVTAIDLVDHVSAVVCAVNGEGPSSEECCRSVGKVPVYIVVHDVITNERIVKYRFKFVIAELVDLVEGENLANEVKPLVVPICIRDCVYMSCHGENLY